jgi:hypothetical protein
MKQLEGKLSFQQVTDARKAAEEWTSAFNRAREY